MIVVRIQGGLGNQLFQYALAYSLMHKKKANVALDISFYNDTFTNKDGATKREFKLSNFNIGDIKLIYHTEEILRNNFLSKIKRFTERLFLPYYKQSYIIEKKAGYDNNILEISANTYLDGFWQSYKYFEEFSQQLTEKIQLIVPLSIEAQNFSTEIEKNRSSVSIHIRRMDYVSKYSTFYHQLTIDYYIEAIKMMSMAVPKMHLYVFSDDINWCKENLNFDVPKTFISSPSLKEEEELILMSKCSNNIIANSTFSWWAAWLNKNNDKMVIAPKDWFIKNEENFNSSIYPNTWTRL